MSREIKNTTVMDRTANGSNFQVILFDEMAQDHYPGFIPTSLLSDLPVWGNFRVRDVISISDPGKLPYSTFTCTEHSVFDSLKGILGRSGCGKYLILWRTGNVALFNWHSLLRNLNGMQGIVKVRVGKVPTELYVMQRKNFLKVLSEVEKEHPWQKGSFISWLFDTFFFNNFERIVELAGYSFLMRNVFEYYTENLKLLSYLNDTGFLNIYRRLETPFDSRTTVTDSGVIKNSLLGAGAHIEGLVEGSIIFHDVIIGRNARIRNSVILPSNTIEQDVVIENSLVLEGKERVIEHGSKIGGFSEIRNRDYPSTLKRGLTLIGEKISIPAASIIGSACLVYGEKEDLSSRLMVEDGSTYKG